MEKDVESVSSMRERRICRKEGTMMILILGMARFTVDEVSSIPVTTSYTMDE